MAFQISNNEWVSGNWRLAEITKNRRLPFYFYNLDDALERARRFHKSQASVHYAMKANSNRRLLSAFSKLGLGADVVSSGELRKALDCGFSPGKIIFSGVGKDREDLEAALKSGIYQINVESFEELRLLDQIAGEQRKIADVALRLNILLEAPTHKNIQTAAHDSKFGIDVRQLPEVLAWLKGRNGIRLNGLAVHIGSQIEDLGVFARMRDQMLTLTKELNAESWNLKRLDLGGGLGIDYKTTGADDLNRLDQYLECVRQGTGDLKLSLEPGRFLVARMGVLIAKVIHVKRTPNSTFVILNAGMNCLMRPALYQAYHRIEPLSWMAGQSEENYTIVGPICESTDKFAVDRKMKALAAGDWVGIFDAGAYGAVMANTYNESALPEEVSVLDGRLEVT